MGNYQPPLTPHQSYGPAPNSAQNPPVYEPQRPIEYGVYATPMDSFIESTIDETIHNPLAYIAGGDYESNSSADRSLHDSSDFANLHPTTIRNGPPLHPATQQMPKPPPTTQLSTESAGPSNQQKSKKERKSGGERKNTVPTPYCCDACNKFMCSSRSLRRHKSTCKIYLKTTPELTVEEKQL
jgi:hypothetical protein